MRGRRTRKGFTLIELVVALAIFVVVITGVSGALGSFLRLRSIYEQQMIVEQNFGVAVARISQDMRAATENATKMIVAEPANLTMGETLTIYLNGSGTPVTSVTYSLKAGASAGTYAVYRNDEPITEDIRQMVKLYFVNGGGKVCVILVGETAYGGALSRMSFTSLIYTRNSGYPSS